MKEILSDYGEAILYAIVGAMVTGYLAMVLNSITSV